MKNSSGNPSHNFSTVVAILDSAIFSYLSFLLSVFKPYQGNEPCKKYTNT